MEKTVQNNLLYANKVRIGVKTLFQKIKHIQDELKKAMRNFTDDSFWSK